MTGFECGDPVVERTTHCRDVHPILRATRYNASHEEGCSRMRTSTFVVVVLLSIIMAGPRLQAQSHTASQSAIDAALQQHVSTAAADRADVLRVLGNAEVKAVAEKAGLDLRRATTAVASLDGQELTQLADQARQVDEALAGGQSKVTISTTVIIIILLVLILLIVAID
jgi:hypothetical protein